MYGKYRKKLVETSVDTMINILSCDVENLSSYDEDELDEIVGFESPYGGIEFVCTLRDIKYTYNFCKRLLEECVKAGYIK